MISPMAVGLARVAFLLDIVHVSTRGQFAVATDDTAAIERGESEESHETTHNDLRSHVSNNRTYEGTVPVLQRLNVHATRCEHFPTFQTDLVGAPWSVVCIFLDATNQLLGWRATKTIEIERALSGRYFSRRDDSVTEDDVREQ